MLILKVRKTIHQTIYYVSFRHKTINLCNLPVSNSHNLQPFVPQTDCFFSWKNKSSNFSWGSRVDTHLNCFNEFYYQHVTIRLIIFQNKTVKGNFLVQARKKSPKSPIWKLIYTASQKYLGRDNFVIRHFLSPFGEESLTDTFHSHRRCDLLNIKMKMK